jgi:hypothetical protein
MRAIGDALTPLVIALAPSVGGSTIHGEKRRRMCAD